MNYESNPYTPQNRVGFPARIGFVELNVLLKQLAELLPAFAERRKPIRPVGSPLRADRAGRIRARFPGCNEVVPTG